MVYKPDPTRSLKRTKQLVNARKWAIRLITSIIGVGLLVSEVKRLRNEPLDSMDYGYIALFFFTGWLIFSWIWCTDREMDLLFEWADPEKYEPPSGIAETLVILVLALLLVFLLFSSRNPLLYSVVFTIYNLTNVFSEKRLYRELSEIFPRSKSRAQGDLCQDDLKTRTHLYLRGIEVLEKYYLQRPHRLRVCIILAFSTLGLLLGALWVVSTSKACGLAAYSVFLLTILAGEVSIWRWRAIRDEELRPITAEINELRHNGENTST